MTIDAHVHMWDLTQRPQPWIEPDSMSVILRDHSLRELEQEMRRADVSAAVLVQVLNDAEETDEHLNAAAGSAIVGVVGWVDLLADDLGERLDALQAHPSGTVLLGVRHQALAEPDPELWLTEAVARGAFKALGERKLPFDLMFRPEHLPTVYDVARAHPGTAFVLDHAGKPAITAGWGSDESRKWAKLVTELAELPNLTCKLSGLTTMADVAEWKVEDLTPYVEHLLGCFGPERLLFGSDWPVSRRAGDYVRTVGAVRTLVAGLSPTEQHAVLEGTANRIYALTSRSA